MDQELVLRRPDGSPLGNGTHTTASAAGGIRSGPTCVPLCPRSMGDVQVVPCVWHCNIDGVRRLLHRRFVRRAGPRCATMASHQDTVRAPPLVCRPPPPLCCAHCLGGFVVAVWSCVWQNLRASDCDDGRGVAHRSVGDVWLRGHQAPRSATPPVRVVGTSPCVHHLLLRRPHRGRNGRWSAQPSNGHVRDVDAVAAWRVCPVDRLGTANRRHRRRVNSCCRPDCFCCDPALHSFGLVVWHVGGDRRCHARLAPS